MVHAADPSIPLDSPNQELAIFGVTMKIGKEHQVLEDVFFKPLEDALNGKTPVENVTFNPKSLLPSSLDGWHYEGSLTTHHDAYNQDNADWFVFDQSIEVSQRQFDLFEQYLETTGHHHNNHKPEPIRTAHFNDFILGTDASDILRGTDGEDKIYGKRGWDTLQGRGGNDYLDGNAGNDQLFGGNGEDYLVGAAGSDVLFGGEGNDTLVGVNPYGNTPGEAEVDTIIGSLGSAGDDIIVLGDGDTVFYAYQTGFQDRAIIQKFDNTGHTQDKIQLTGSASDYKLTAWGSDTRLYYTGGAGDNSLIAIVQGIDANSLNLSDSTNFIYV